MNKAIVKHQGKIIGEVHCQCVPHIESGEFIRLFVEAPTEIIMEEGSYEEFVKASKFAALLGMRNPKCVLRNT